VQSSEKIAAALLGELSELARGKRSNKMLAAEK
jgi:hypothetical protein